jgi:hypothetical protein
MNLRESFTDQAQKKAEETAAKLRSDASKELQKIADKLPKNLKKHVSKNGVERDLVEFVYTVNTFVRQGGDVETLDGYKRLQEVCSSPEIDMKLGLEQKKSEYGPYGELSVPYNDSEDNFDTYCVVAVTPNRPYSDSRSPVIIFPVMRENIQADNTLRDSLLDLPGEELRALLAQVMEERPDDFSAVANPAELNQAIKATPPLAPRKA